MPNKMPSRPQSCSVYYDIYYSASAKATVRGHTSDTGTVNRPTSFPAYPTYGADVNGNIYRLQTIGGDTWSDNGDGTWTVILTTVEHSTMTADSTYDSGLPPSPPGGGGAGGPGDPGSPSNQQMADNAGATAQEAWDEFGILFVP